MAATMFGHGACLMDSISRVTDRIHQIQCLLGEQSPTNRGFGGELRQAVAERHPQARLEASPVRAGEMGGRMSPATLAPLIEEAAGKSGLAEELISAVIATESGYRPDAVSRTGAAGLMQLMPGTAHALGVDDPFDPRQNVLAGAAYLRQQLDRFGSVEKALAAYNAGPEAVAHHHGV